MFKIISSTAQGVCSSSVSTSYACGLYYTGCSESCGRILSQLKGKADKCQLNLGNLFVGSQIHVQYSFFVGIGIVTYLGHVLPLIQHKSPLIQRKSTSLHQKVTLSKREGRGRDSLTIKQRYFVRCFSDALTLGYFCFSSPPTGSNIRKQSLSHQQVR